MKMEPIRRGSYGSRAIWCRFVGVSLEALGTRRLPLLFTTSCEREIRVYNEIREPTDRPLFPWTDATGATPPPTPPRATKAGVETIAVGGRRSRCGWRLIFSTMSREKKLPADAAAL